MSHRFAALTLALIAASTLASAQTLNAPTPDTAAAAYVPTMTFEVASIRESKVDLANGISIGGGFTPANSSNLRLINNDVRNLIDWAYGDNPNPVEGVPKDFFYVYYNVEAKADSATEERLAKLPKDQLHLEQQHMIQSCLPNASTSNPTGKPAKARRSI